MASPVLDIAVSIEALLTVGTYVWWRRHMRNLDALRTLREDVEDAEAKMAAQLRAQEDGMLGRMLPAPRHYDPLAAFDIDIRNRFENYFDDHHHLQPPPLLPLYGDPLMGVEAELGLQPYQGRLVVGEDGEGLTPNERARHMLTTHLTPQQLCEYDRMGHFKVTAQDGLTYRIFNRYQSNIYGPMEKPNGKDTWCIVPRGHDYTSIPLEDHLVGCMLLLQGDFLTFRSTAL